MRDVQGESGSGWVRRLWPVALVAACAAAYFLVSAPSSAMAGWSADFESALARAKAEHKPVLVAFHSQNCPPCYAMERTVLGEGPVMETLKGVVPVRVDPFQRTDLGTRYEVMGTPTYLLLSPNGKVLGRRMGFVPMDEFILFLDQAYRRPPEDVAAAPPAAP